MNKFALMLAACIAVSTGAFCAQTNISIGTVNMQRCVENSLSGQKFDTEMKDLETQLKKTLDEKQDTLKEIADKLQDEDYLDSLSPEAEKEMQVKGGNLQMELQQMGQQAMQVLQQARQMAMQELSRQISTASETVAASDGFTLVISQEACLFSSNTNDVTEKVVAVMNQNFEKEKAAAAADADSRPAA